MQMNWLSTSYIQFFSTLKMPGFQITLSTPIYKIKVCLSPCRLRSGALDIGDRDDITQIGGLSDPPLCLTRDDSINAMRPRVREVLLSNPVARVKETGAGGANGSDSAKLLRSHHRPV
jgi:hypothetical protein